MPDNRIPGRLRELIAAGKGKRVVVFGDLIADALRQASGADIAVMNSGGIRTDLPEGDLTYGDIFAVSPFDNYPAFLTLTGREVEQLLRATSRGARGIMQVSNGWKYER